MRRWKQAKTGEGRVVLISGEPGIGKSRLTAALSRAYRERAPYTLALFLLAAPSGQRTSSIHCPARTRRGFARDDTAEQKLGKLRALLAPGTPDEDEIALVSRAAVFAECCR